jgi:hypothetical protein
MQGHAWTALWPKKSKKRYTHNDKDQDNDDCD